MHTTVKKSLVFLIIAALILPLLQVFIPVGQASAANVNFVWINRATLMRTTDNHYFVDPDISDDTHQYFEQLPATDTSGCKSMLDVLTSGTSPLSAPDSYNYYEAKLNNNQLNKSCSNGDYSTVTQHFAGDAFGNAPVQATYIYYWKDKNTIARLNVGNIMNDAGTSVSIPASTYTIVGNYSATGTNIYREGGDCPDEIAINGSGNLTNGSFTARSTQSGSNAIGVHLNNSSDRATMVALGSTQTADGCYEGKTTVVVTMQAYAKSDPASGNPTASATTSPTGDAASANDSCYKALPVFGWILCGVIDLADSAFSSMRSFVFNLLNVPSAEIGSSSQLQSTWSVMKNLATAGLVLVAVVMVASQIFSFDFMSAYTIKKVLPRLVIAAIAMQFSWFIFTLLIQISNAAGIGIYKLLINAFGAQDIMDIVGAARGAGANVTAGAVTVIGTIGATVAGFTAVGLFANGGALMVVFTMLGVLITILVALFTLIVRFMLIVILLVISPLAILAWILPGTQNLWQSWWKLFSRLLAMYALIAVLFAAGAIGAKIAISIGLVNGQNGGLSLIAAIVMYFAPLFLIPSTFKFAGGMFTTATNMLNKAGDKAKNGGYFGTRARAKESYKENKKAKGLELAGRSTGPGLVNRFNRTRGRIAAGTAGATGDYAEKLRASEAKAEFENSRLESDSVVKAAGESYKAQSDARAAILSAREGQSVEIKDASGNVVRTVTATKRLQRATALTAAQNKEHAALDAYEAVAPGDLNALANSNAEAFTVLDKYAPGFSRGTPTSGGHITDKSFQTAVNNFDSIGGKRDTGRKDSSGNPIYEKGRQQEVGDEIKKLLVSADESDQRQAFGHLTAVARNGNVSQADLKDLADLVGIADLSRLRTDPNAKLDFVDPTDPSLGYKIT